MPKDNLPIPLPEQNSALSLRRTNQLIEVTDKILARSQQEVAAQDASLILRSRTNGLGDLVPKKHNTGYIFINIMNDLGVATADGDNGWPPLLLMTYAYARRAAAAALYVQGHITKDLYEYTKTIFKSIQLKTGVTVEFQEQAFAESIKFLSEYSPALNGLTVKMIVSKAELNELPSKKLIDSELFKFVIDDAYQKQQSQQTSQCDEWAGEGSAAYERGDYKQALTWFRKAAELGHADAQYNLGGLFVRGHGVPLDYTQARAWFRRAADQGGAEAQYMLGALYDKGLGVTKDDDQAIEWYRKAAEQGLEVAQAKLSLMLLNANLMDDIKKKLGL